MFCKQVLLLQRFPLQKQRRAARWLEYVQQASIRCCALFYTAKSQLQVSSHTHPKPAPPNPKPAPPNPSTYSTDCSSTLGKALKHMLAKHRPRRRCARVSFLKEACYEFTNYLLGFSEKDSNSRSAFTFSLFNIIHVYTFCLLDTAFCLRER